MTETYLPRAERAGARLLTGHRVDRLVLDGGRAVRAARRPRDRRAAGDGRLRPRHRLRRGASRPRPCSSGRVCAGAIGRTLAVHPTVKLAARFPDADQRARRRAGPPGQGVRARPVVRRLGVEPGPRRPGAHQRLAPSRIAGPLRSSSARSGRRIVDPVSGRSPYTNRNSSTPYAAAVSRSRRKPSTLRSRGVEAGDRAPTHQLNLVAPRRCSTPWPGRCGCPGSGTIEATRLITPIW